MSFAISNTTQNTPQLDRNEAELFLFLLTGSRDEPVMWQCFNDDKDHDGHAAGNDEHGKPKCSLCRSLTKAVYGPLAEHWDELADLNARGAGVFVQINACSGKRGTAGVTALRAVFIDEDGKNEDETPKVDPIRAGHEVLAALPPTFMVESAHGPHAYWVLHAGQKLEDFKPAQKQLAAHFRTDPVINNLDRVMRVPGFLHKKDPRSPFPVKVVRPISPATRFTIGDVLRAFPAPVSPLRPKPKLTLVRGQGECLDSRDDVLAEVQAMQPNGFGKPRYDHDHRPRTALEKAKAYLSNVPPTKRSGVGNTEAFAMACVCVHDFALSPQDAIEALTAWNQACIHPREPAELESLVQNAVEYAGKDEDKPKGWRLDRLPPPTPPTTASSIVASVAALLPPANDPPPSYRACYKTARQLLSEKFQPPEVLAPYIIGGTITEIDGEPKAGKTTFMLAIVRALLTGESFLGEQTVKSKVLYLNESPESSFAEALKRAHIPDGCTDDLTILTFGQVGRFGMNWGQKVADAVSFATANGIKVLVVDTFSQWADITGEGENQAGTMMSVIAPLHVATAAGLAVVIIRHDRKSGGPAGQSARGSSVVAGSVDNIVHLTLGDKPKDTNERWIEYRGRHSCFPVERVITYATATGEFRSLGGSKDVEQSRDQQMVRKALGVLESANLDDIFNQLRTMGELDIRRTKLQNLLMEMSIDGSVHKQGSGRKGSPYNYSLP